MAHKSNSDNNNNNKRHSTWTWSLDSLRPGPHRQTSGAFNSNKLIIKGFNSGPGHWQDNPRPGPHGTASVPWYDTYYYSRLGGSAHRPPGLLAPGDINININTVGIVKNKVAVAAGRIAGGRDKSMTPLVGRGHAAIATAAACYCCRPPGRSGPCNRPLTLACGQCAGPVHHSTPQAPSRASGVEGPKDAGRVVAAKAKGV